MDIKVLDNLRDVQESLKLYYNKKCRWCYSSISCDEKAIALYNYSRVNMVMCFCNEHKKQYEKIPPSCTLIPLSDKEIFYLRIKNEY